MVLFFIRRARITIAIIASDANVPSMNPLIGLVGNRKFLKLRYVTTAPRATDDIIMLLVLNLNQERNMPINTSSMIKWI